jgi:hypothetical protein
MAHLNRQIIHINHKKSQRHIFNRIPKSGKKNKLRKDRYSALLMANDAARRLNIERVSIKYDEDYYKNVGFAKRHVGERGKDYYSGPQWFADAAKELYNY